MVHTIYWSNLSYSFWKRAYNLAWLTDLNKASILKLKDFMLAQPTATSEQFIYLISLTSLRSICGKIFRHFTMMLHTGIVSPFWYYQDMARFKHRSSDWNITVLTIQLHAYHQHKFNGLLLYLYWSYCRNVGKNNELILICILFQKGDSFSFILKIRAKKNLEKIKAINNVIFYQNQLFFFFQI